MDPPLPDKGQRTQVAEIRLEPRVTLAYQDRTGSIYVALAVRVSLNETRQRSGSLWQSSVSAPFPDGFADANMIVATVDVDRIEIHARGVTPEPFGHGRTLIERTTTGWRFAQD